MHVDNENKIYVKQNWREILEHNVHLTLFHGNLLQYKRLNIRI